MQAKLSQCCSDTILYGVASLPETRPCEMGFGNKTTLSRAEQKPILGGAACAQPAADAAPSAPLDCSQSITGFSISAPFLGASSALCFPFKLIEIKVFEQMSWALRNLSSVCSPLLSFWPPSAVAALKASSAVSLNECILQAGHCTDSFISPVLAFIMSPFMFCPWLNSWAAL